MAIVLGQVEINPIESDVRYTRTDLREYVQHQGHIYRVLNYVRCLTPCECFIRGLAWAISCITIISIIFCRASVSKLLNEVRTKPVRKIVYTPFDLQRKFDELKEHIKNIYIKPAFINELVGQDLSLENYSSLKKWLKARDTLVVWKEIAKEAKIEEGNLDVCGFPDVETTVEKASKFGEWCAQNVNVITNIKDLQLYCCQLTYLPKEIFNLSQLKSVSLAGNLLKHLPREIGNLSQLTYLSLAYNRLRNLPVEVGNLYKLKKLSLTGNQLTFLLGEVDNFTKLRALVLNPLRKVHKEVATNLEKRGCTIYW